MNIEEARAALLVEVRDNMYETPNPSKNEGWIAATMQAADEYAMTVLEEVEGAAAGYASAEVNEVFVEESIMPLRAEIAALGPQEEGT